MGTWGTWALLMFACSSPDARRPDVAGGQDGGGQLGLGLRWDERVFVQELWQGSNVSFIGINQRDEEVLLEVFDFECSTSETTGDSCQVGQRRAEWTVPPQGSRSVDVNELITEEYGLVALRVDGESFGLLDKPRAPRPATLPTVSNKGLNGGSFNEAFQVETESATASTTFKATLSLSQPGELAMLETTAKTESVQFARIVGASSAGVDVTEVPGGFHAILPPTISPEAPVLIELELSLPGDFEGGPLIGLNAGIYCLEGTTAACDRRTEITRALLVP